MRIFVFSFLTIVVGSLTGLATGGRAQSWRVESVAGSAQLSLDALRWVVIPEGASMALQNAVGDLQALAVRRVGVELVESSGTSKNALVLKRVGRDSVFGSFSIRRERTSVVIRSASDAGLLNGVYALCADVYGARWYWAAEPGAELVGQIPDKFPERRWREAPALIHRQLYPSTGEYARRNRLTGGFQFNHALAKTFSPEVYAQEPEVFASVGGKRQRPRGHHGTDRQPDLTSERAIEIAAEAAIKHFESKPESRSFSLSINDNMIFDDSERTRSALGELQYFRGRPNYTDLVFGFMNRVAEKVEELGKAESGKMESGCPLGVRGATRKAEGLTAERVGWISNKRLRRSLLRSHSSSLIPQASALRPQSSIASIWKTPSGQDRYLTALSYYWTEQSPSFELHPRVLPVLTSDRAQWHDPEYREEDRALIERWSNSGAERIGTWDYYFGAPYPYPRQLNQWIMESIPYLAENDVTVFFSQLPSSWGLDGGKAWLTSQLLWDPKQDAEALLDEFYSNFFGEAAQPIRHFYETAEAWRNEHEGEWWWIKFYRDEAGIELFSNDVLREMRAAIEAAKIAVAHDSKRLARVTIVSDAFRFTELMAAYQQARRDLVEAVFGQAVREQDLLSFIEARREFKAYAKALVKDPMHARLSLFLTVLQSDPVPLAIAALVQRGDAPDEVPGYSRTLSVAKKWAQNSQSFRSTLRNSTLTHSGNAPVARNFLGPAVPAVPGWKFSFRPSQNMAIDAIADRAGVRVSGADVCFMSTTLPVISEMDYLLDLSVAYRTSPDNRTRIELIWRDRDGKKLKARVPLRFLSGEWSEAKQIVIPLRAPKQAYDLDVQLVTARQYEGDYLEVHRVDFGRLY